MQIHGHFIGGTWREPAATLPVIAPSDGSPFARIARGTAADISAAVTAAQSALDGQWGRLCAAKRGRLLTRLSHSARH
jgi:aldehyde dehydrogenase (NAD+)